MFDLEQFIIEWRKQMLAAGIKSPIPLDELESHLREEFGNQIKSGQSPQSAFDMAAKSIGRGVELKKEFIRSESLTTRFVKLMGIGCGAVALTFSVWILSFLLLDATGVVMKTVGVLAVTTIFATWKYNYKWLPVIPNPFTRSMIGLACCVGSVAMIQLFVKYILTDAMVHPARVEMPLGRVLALFEWAWAAMAILSSIGSGLEKAAREHQTASS